MTLRSELDPHGGTRTLTYGAPLEEARAAMILVHGRGASPEDIMGVAPEVDPGSVAYLAPAAAGGAWYPQTFMNPQPSNQPWLNSALGRVGGLISHINGAGIPSDKIVLLGFSQGACLASEYVARHPMRYGGLAVLSGGLIGTDEELTGYTGSLNSTPVFFGCSNVDPHIPEARVRRSGDIMKTLGAQVEVNIYPGMGHNINQDEITIVRAMLEKLVTVSE
jgi:phospholipase/carboxylesterase